MSGASRDAIFAVSAPKLARLRIRNVEPRKVVLAIVKAHAPDTSIDEELPLGAGGLGLDSIAIAEVLLECEERFGISCGLLLESDGLTIARLAQHLSAATQ